MPIISELLLAQLWIWRALSEAALPLLFSSLLPNVLCSSSFSGFHLSVVDQFLLPFWKAHSNQIHVKAIEISHSCFPESTHFKNKLKEENGI